MRQLLTLCAEGWGGRASPLRQDWAGPRPWEEILNFEDWFNDHFKVTRRGRPRVEEYLEELFKTINVELISQDIPAMLIHYDIPKYSRRVDQSFLSITPSHHEISVRGEGNVHSTKFDLQCVDTSEWDQQLKDTCQRKGIRWATPAFWLEMQVPLDREPYAKFYYEIPLSPLQESFDVFDLKKGLPINIAQHSYQSTKGLINFNLPAILSNPWDSILKQVCEKYAFNWVTAQFHLLISYHDGG